MPGDEGIEGTVPQADLATVVLGFEPLAREEAHEFLPRGASRSPAGRSSPKSLSPLSGGRPNLVPERVIGMPLDPVDEDLGSEPIAPSGNAQLDRQATSSSVELRRPAGTRSCPTAPPPVLDVEQAGRDEPIEVERGEGPADPDGGRRLIAIDGIVAIRDVFVQRAPDRLAEDGRRRDRIQFGLGVGCVGHRGVSLYRMSSLTKDLTNLVERSNNSAT